MLRARAGLLGYSELSIEASELGEASNTASLKVWHQPVHETVTPGQLNRANAPYVLACLDRSIEACQDGRAFGLVTAPVQKSVIAEAGIPFTGHTEYLAQKTGTPRVVMMLVGGGLRVALVTTHLPLKEVSASLSPEMLDDTLDILHRDLQALFGLTDPRIKVTGLNPHAGEAGHLGTEEITLIAPAIQRAQQRGIQVSGPWPADTLFTPAMLEDQDAILTMYHDQGLPVLKMKSFGLGVNVTLGLPIRRTSVDHGTALDLAGTGRADSGSLLSALQLMRAFRER
jgi:4-hydroxythreonine-4-phosphate dehydrogenase